MFAIVLNYICESDALEEVYYHLESAGFEDADASMQQLLNAIEEQL